MITSVIFLPFVKGRVPSWHFLFTYKLSEPKIECFYIFVDAATRLFFSTFYPFSITDVDKGWRWICLGHWVLISILIPLLQCGALVWPSCYYQCYIRYLICALSSQGIHTIYYFIWKQKKLKWKYILLTSNKILIKICSEFLKDFLRTILYDTLNWLHIAVVSKI